MMLDILFSIWTTTSEMAPYLIFGFLVAGVLSVWFQPEWVERHLSGIGSGPVLKATLLGVPLPLCSCGVIPVAASLRRAGASRGATAAFLLSTPQTGVDSILVTLSLLGPLFAVLRPLAAIVTGLAGGYLIQWLCGPEPAAAGDSAPGKQGAACDDCEAGAPVGTRWIRALHYGFVTLPRDLARTLLMGLVAAGLIDALVPADFLGRLLGTGFLPLFVMMAVGIPLYVCATGSVPVAASLMQKGVSPGAAFVFLMTGPATNTATIAVVWKLLGRRAAAIYLGTVAVGAFGFGALLNIWVSPASGHLHHAGHFMMPAWINTSCAVLLFGLLAWAFLPRKAPAAIPDGADVAVFKVSGMSCDRCRQAVERTMRAMPGVDNVSVDLASGEARAVGRGFDPAALEAAVGQLGYTMKIVL